MTPLWEEVLTGVNTTKRYLAQRKRGAPINHEAEAELVTFWATYCALTLIRHPARPIMRLNRIHESEYVDVEIGMMKVAETPINSWGKFSLRKARLA